MPDQLVEISSPHQKETRRQHMAPQSYLRRFAFNPTTANKKQRLWVYDKIQKKTFSDAIVNVAQERDFNDLPLDVLADDYAEDVKSPESILSRFEGHFKIVLDNFVANWQETGITHEMRYELAEILAVQMVRTRATRARTAVAYSDLSSKQLQALLDRDIAPDTGRAQSASDNTPEHLARLGQLSFLFDREQMTNVCQVTA
ncbi:DUF4238 domain-containing protein [Armatimonas sp.]|uniref:DUF4238 domain-containing protein n=1 Tax=Armatimonas sp. TaxID=1872638 RepID=UPI00286BDE92|nr:DUF4238 domain-containing protein [Armatimonas sp.]